MSPRRIRTEPSNAAATKAVAVGAMLASFALGVLAPRAASASESPACPSDMTHVQSAVGEACVDRWEASLVEIDEDGSERPHSPYEAPNGKNVKAVSAPGVVPQAHVSLHEAKRACTNAGKRLCRANEWVAACKGPANTKYPYGDERTPGACVDTGRTAPLAKYYRAEERYGSKAMNDPRLNQTPNTVEKTGAAEACTNAYGVHDMVGNLHEWVDDGAFHGGYYLDTKINREGCDYKTTAHEGAYYDYSTGFRCCADPGSLPVDENEPEQAPTPAPEPELAAIEVDDSALEGVPQVLAIPFAPFGGGGLFAAFTLDALPVDDRRLARAQRAR